jgi:hypothetical protein
MPIPGKDGIRRDDKGRLDIQPATLSEIADDPSLLRRLDLDAARPYPITESDLGRVAALIDASPEALSRRMKLLQSRLVGKQKAVLCVSAAEAVEQWKDVPNVRQARLWTVPYEMLRRRSQLSPAETIETMVGFMQFYALPNAPLARGRILQLKGEFNGEPGAIGFYQASRPSIGEIRDLVRDLANLSSSEDLDKYMLGLAKDRGELLKAINAPSTSLSEDKNQDAEERRLKQHQGNVEELIANADLIKMGTQIEQEFANLKKERESAPLSPEKEKQARVEFRQQAIQWMVAMMARGKQDATYWLGLMEEERGNFKSADLYLFKKTIETDPQIPNVWRDGARFNLARLVESQGDLDRAAMLYRSDPEAPDIHGRLLRERWLLEKKE